MLGIIFLFAALVVIAPVFIDFLLFGLRAFFFIVAVALALTILHEQRICFGSCDAPMHVVQR